MINNQCHKKEKKHSITCHQYFFYHPEQRHIENQNTLQLLLLGEASFLHYQWLAVLSSSKKISPSVKMYMRIIAFHRNNII